MAALIPPFPLIPRRVHEVGGPGAVAFALMAAALAEGQGQGRAAVLWVQLAHQGEQLMPWAVAPILSPARLLLVRAEGEADLLWATEEALRSGALGMVIACPQRPLSLTAGRRLQLAAEAGQTTGILIIREGMGSNAAETRWHASPVAQAGDSTAQRWKLIKNKMGTSGEWVVAWDEKTHSLRIFSPAGERAGSAPAIL